MKRVFLFVAILAGHALNLSSAIAAPILWIDDSSGNIGKVDINGTHTVTVVGNPGVVMTDIAFDPSGNLYGTDFTTLYTISKVNGQSTTIGGTGISGTNALVFGTNGTLYGAGNGSNSLYTLNTGTGAGTAVGGSMGTASAGDLAFNGGNLYLAGSNGDLVLVDPSTGNGVNVGLFNVANVFGLATASDGVLYAVAGTEVYSVNTATGALTALFDYSGHGLGDAHGAAFITEAVAPEPATLTLLGIGIAGMAGYGWRRRK